MSASFIFTKTQILSHPNPFPFPFPTALPSIPARTTHHPPPNPRPLLLATTGATPTLVDAAPQVEDKVEEETPKFRWAEIRPTVISEDQRMAISKLPKSMAKRCKALMRQIICYSPQKGQFVDVLSAWVQIMNPIRADWLAVIKELSESDNPFFIQVFEYALGEESFEANVRDYTKMIHVYAKRNQIQDAENTFASMVRLGMVCDQVILTAMIHMYSKAGNFEKVEEVFDEMKLLGQPLDKRAYGAMIMACIRADMPDKGEALFLEMEAQDIYAGSEVYKALLRVYSMRGDCEGSQRVFNAIQLSGTFPDVRQCALLINAYAVAGQSQKARISFENMRRAGVEPNDKCVAVLLAAYEKENNLNAALDLLINLEKDGIMVGKEASELLAEWFRKIGVAEEVALVLKEYVVK